MPDKICYIITRYLFDGNMPSANIFCHQFFVTFSTFNNAPCSSVTYTM